MAAGWFRSAANALCFLLITISTDGEFVLHFDDEPKITNIRTWLHFFLVPNIVLLLRYQGVCPALLDCLTLGYRVSHTHTHTHMHTLTHFTAIFACIILSKTCCQSYAFLSWCSVCIFIFPSHSYGWMLAHLNASISCDVWNHCSSSWLSCYSDINISVCVT